ncbi:ATP-binding protein [Chlorogloeopsis sp. ULAP01]|uniref:ATP-binding protein n=1 Tax=Chlorogloeopsis sp. ULAP01 TaxID=3056483 RepID=UPI0025AAD32F|nr:ATP-binding protein [Chlorogloeopsis sp. ULAP01]MDM9385568.1 ATP-binding protein [Chlorogloeopsis sp. ULAP01]
MQRPQSKIVTLEDILITEELSRRNPRSANLLKENQALHALARQLVNQPQTILQTLVDIALDLCIAGTAGVSLLEITPTGEEFFRWNVLAGALAQYVGGTTPRNFSPCGTCLERGTPQLYQYPERYFTYLQAANTPIVEGLVLPLIADNHALGTIWILSHDEQRHFDSEDVRVMTSLADFTAAAVLVNQRQTQELLAANIRLETEIEERKLIEESARENEAYFRAIADLVPDLLWRNDLDGKAIWYNKRWLDYTGQTLEEAQGDGWLEAIHPSDRASCFANFHNAVKECRPLRQEHRIKGTDGNYRWFLVQAQPVNKPNGRIIWFGAAIDIQEQRTAIEQLRESEECLRAMIENLPGGAVFVVDRDLRYLLAEGEALAIAGFQPEDLFGHTIFEVLPSELATYYEPMYRKALAGEPFEHEHHAHDRTYISRGTPLRAENGEIYAVLAVSYDITDRKRAEATLRESEERFRAFVMASSDMVYRMSADWREMRNLEGKKILINTEVPSQTWIETYIPPAEQSLVWAAIEAAIRTKTTFELEHRVIRQDGTIGWVFSRAIPMLNEQGDIIEWFGTGSDITARKQTEAALRASEEKYRSLFENVNDGFCLIEMLYDNGQPIDYRFLEVNPAFETQSGFKHAIGKTARDFLPNLEAEFLTNYETVLGTGEPIEFEIQSADMGRYFQVAAYRYGDPQNKQLAIVFSDITERKQAEEKLRRAAEMDAFRVKLSDALRSLHDPIQIQAEACRLLGEHLGVDRAYYVEVNEAESYARVNQDYLRGDSPSLVGVFRLADYGWIVPLLQRGETIIVADAENSDIVPEADCKAMATVRITAHISTPLVKAGTLVGALCVTESAPRQWLAAEVELVRETAERIWAAIERDRAEDALRESEIQRIREQAAREEERQRAESLAELDRAKTLFFSNVSHEFRTPLTLILAPLQDALSDSVNLLPQEQRERLELAHRNSLRLLKLVNTLLDFSRIEAGRIEALYKPTDLAMFTAELASVFRSAIEQAGLRLVVDCPPMSEPVYVDQEMWEKIVLNLLSNAFKFTFEGEIAVRLHLADDHHVTLQVEDTGTGIKPSELPHLFERFYQVRGTKARTYEGSGIGLALVQELIKLHGGTVDVSSTVGQGSCFTVTIPLGTAHLPSERIQATRTLTSTASGAAPYVQEAQRWLPEEGTRDKETRGITNTQSPVPNSQSRQSTQRGKPPHVAGSPIPRILIVDDNADMRDYLMRILSEYVEVEAVADGAVALAIVTERVPDLVLSDVMMPQMDGFGLLKALRADARTKEIPIILLSARAGEESVIEGLQAGADDYLIKPFSAQELITRVNTHLQMGQLRSEALHQERTTSRMKDKLLAEVSHELNAPLVAILGWTRLLRSSTPNPTMLMKALETIERNATVQAKLIRDLLDISRITAGKTNLDLQCVALESIVGHAIATVRQSLETKEICLECICEPLSITVQGDPERLQQIVLNLLTNAIKFTPQGGRIEVRLHILQNQAQIVVSDNGKGISAEFLPHVFDIFCQSESSHSKGGLGLGLAIAHHLVELHGGTIIAESPGVGGGATFTVNLPLVGVSL